MGHGDCVDNVVETVVVGSEIKISDLLSCQSFKKIGKFRVLFLRVTHV